MLWTTANQKPPSSPIAVSETPNSAWMGRTRIESTLRSATLSAVVRISNAITNHAVRVASGRASTGLAVGEGKGRIIGDRARICERVRVQRLKNGAVLTDLPVSLERGPVGLSMALFHQFGTVVFALGSLFVAARLLWMGHRTGQKPERFLGLGIGG